MNLQLKRIYNFLVTAALVVLLFFISVFTLIHLYQDEIVTLFIKEANKYINTPVKTEKVSVSLFTKFPDVAIAFENVWIQESFKGSEQPLAKAKNIYCTFSVWDLIQKKYRIQKIHLENAEVYLKIRANGSTNFNVINSTATEDSSPGSLSFDLQEIELKEVLFDYDDRKSNQHYNILAHKAEAGLHITDNLYNIDLAGVIKSNGLQIDELTYLPESLVQLETKLLYNTDGITTIKSSYLKIGESEFEIKGSVDDRKDTKLDLSFVAHQTDFQTLNAILPSSYTHYFNTYQSSGNLQLSGEVKGVLTANAQPAININFSAKNASLYHPDYKQAVEKINLTGSYTNGSKQNSSTSVLHISNFTASLNGRPIQGGFVLSDFNNQHLNLKAKAELEAGSFLKFYPIETVKSAEGIINFDISFNGHLKDLKQAKTMNRIKAEGEIITNGLSIQLKNTAYPLNNLNGSFIVRNNDLAISNFSGKAGNSSFVINGLFKNVFAYLLLEDQPIVIEADLRSRVIDLDELLADANAQSSASTSEDVTFYAFDISPKLDLYFRCKAEYLKFERFHAKDVTGELTVKNGIAKFDNINLKAAGGSMQLNGTVDAQRTNLILVDVDTKFKDIYVDSAFYIFRNFNQDFLTDRNLQGRVTTNVKTRMTFDKKLHFNYDALIVEADARIADGKLLNFEPMQSLSRFIDEKRLADISFSEIASTIQVRNKTIYLPETIIRSNISTVTVKGTHTFDQHINYNVKVPVQSLLGGKRKNVPSGAYQSDDAGMHLFLHIIGTTDDYKISYDTDAVRVKIANDIKKEGKELKEVFQNKGNVTKKAVEVEEDEYFDW